MNTSAISSLFDPNMILFNVEAKDYEDLLKKLSAQLIEKGYAKESFEDAVIEREKVYPTGLPTPGVMVALPHTKPEYVIKPAILVANLKEPVFFKEMGNGVNDIPAELVFVMAIDNPEQQVDVLKKLMDIFSNKEILTSLKSCTEVVEVIDILETQVF
ncbi:PTS sugar transporter subunit IIA [Sporosalibacterium faouarense]|uniref:PTS sugar transporter subunit IIA n=1 Tax=Sporosalibacterium faouarense TaxID=516123 RepID=UPI00141C1764|nr:PTS sugar transporter subunit IIA [Sporosalibacterium faouarense]MTI46604.1 PTS sugar transporter subunit IIA [Bacillota bacterium]